MAAGERGTFGRTVPIDQLRLAAENLLGSANVRYREGFAPDE